MASTYTIDASVFLNAFNPYEEGHETSHQFLALLQETGKPIIVPMLLLPEVAAAVGRGSGESDLAKKFANTISELPHLIWAPFDLILARPGSLLVTLDQE